MSAFLAFYLIWRKQIVEKALFIFLRKLNRLETNFFPPDHPLVWLKSAGRWVENFVPIRWLFSWKKSFRALLSFEKKKQQNIPIISEEENVDIKSPRWDLWPLFTIQMHSRSPTGGTCGTAKSRDGWRPILNWKWSVCPIKKRNDRIEICI